MRDWLRRLPPAGRLLTILVLAALGYATWWWLGEQRAAETIDATAPKQPDNYFRELELVRHDEQGRPELRLDAEYAEHFEDEPWIHLHELDASGLEAGPGWRLTAGRGRMTDDGVELEAWDDVVLARDSEGTTRMLLETSRLSINTDTQVAVTEAPVLITQGASRISGHGMWASLADDRLRLDSNVEAHYEK